VSWSLPGNASDGNYRYEVSATAGSTSYRATGRFSVSGGQIFEQKLRKGDYSPSFWHAAANVLNYLGETVLDMLVPVAQAQGDALVSSAFPTVEFDDTNDVGTNWEILAAAFGFVIVDDFGGTLPLEIDQTPLSELSFLSDPNGDVSFANDAVFVDRDAIRLGVGTITPTSAFHVMKADNTARILVEETAPNVTQQLFAQEWRFRAAGDGFRVSLGGTGGPEMTVLATGGVTMGPGGAANFDLDPTGSLTLAGTLTELSDVNAKEAFTDIDGQTLLARPSRPHRPGLPRSLWPRGRR
jgi:hypothetical protein